MRGVGQDDHALRRTLAMGLGRGWLAARDRGREATALVTSIVLDDPRIDRQVEQRDAYFATLLLAIDADVSVLIAALEAPLADERDGWLVRGTLGELARRGVASARAALAAAAPRDAAARLELELLEVTPSRHRPPLARAVRTAAELAPILVVLEREARRTTPRTREEAVAYRTALRALEEVPAAHALPWARTALEAPWPIALGAQRVLERHATATDRETIEALAATALAAEQHHALCGWATALGTIGDPRSVPLLTTIYDTARYSYVRGLVLRALAPHTGDGRVDARMRESLWDADVGARVEACASAEVADSVVRARLETLASDLAESLDVREAARSRLAS
jgi:hypothetical protein